MLLALNGYAEVLKDSKEGKQHRLYESLLEIMLFLQALQRTIEIVKSHPKMQETYLLQATAFLRLQKFAAAVKSCRIAEDIANVKSTGVTKAGRLLDEIAFEAAEKGSLAGFDGRCLEVCNLYCLSSSI